jgi:hypothetical protein
MKTLYCTWIGMLISTRHSRLLKESLTYQRPWLFERHQTFIRLYGSFINSDLGIWRLRQAASTARTKIAHAVNTGAVHTIG